MAGELLRGLTKSSPLKGLLQVYGVPAALRSLGRSPCTGELLPGLTKSSPLKGLLQVYVPFDSDLCSERAPTKPPNTSSP